MQDGPNAAALAGTLRTLYSFLPNDLPSALAVAPPAGPGLPFRGNTSKLYERPGSCFLGVFSSVSAVWTCFLPRTSSRGRSTGQSQALATKRASITWI